MMQVMQHGELPTPIGTDIGGFEEFVGREDAHVV